MTVPSHDSAQNHDDPYHHNDPYHHEDAHYHDDAHWMQAALEWSRKGRGWTSPRPSVGCVIVRATPDGPARLLGGGHTQPGHGNPHAEVMALRMAKEAGEDTRGATAYVTLEPCCHWATTPPCTDALIEAGIRRVVFGVYDPNPAVNGRGETILRDAGLEVRPGFMERECFRAQEDFLKHIVSHRPFVTLKCAASLDGKIATREGESQWISGPESRGWGHRLRHEHDAVLVGIGTALADDPLLTVRLDGHWKQPARIVVDSQARLSPDARMFRNLGDNGPPVYVAVTENAPVARCEQLRLAGATLLPIPPRAGRVDLSLLMKMLHQKGIYSVLIEGGAHIAGAVLEAGLVDKVVFFMAPMVMGEGLPAIAGWGAPALAGAPRLSDVQVNQAGADVVISGYL